MTSGFHSHYCPRCKAQKDCAKITHCRKEETALCADCVYEDLKKNQLRQLIVKLRAVAEPVGTMHAWWDAILDMESFLEGKSTILKYDVDGWVVYAEQLLAGKSK
jgi:hypothetical protein